MRSHRSHSQLNSFTKCGHQYYLTRVLRKPETPCVWLPAGKAVHTGTEKFDLETWDWQPAEMIEMLADIDIWADAFTAAFEAELDLQRAAYPDEKKWRAAGRVTKERPNKEDVAFWHSFGRHLMKMYVEWRVSTADIWEIALVNGAPGIEVEVTYPLGGVPMKGYVDRLLRSKLDGRLVVVDLKSGSRTPDSPGQLATYAIQLEEQVGEPVLWGAWYNARTGKLNEPQPLTWSEGMLGNVYSMLDRAIEQGIFLPNVDSHCKGCGVAQFCNYFGGNENADSGNRAA